MSPPWFDGQTLTANSQYLTLNGKPWLPVMGEFHYSRVPREDWEPEILKMKAGRGVDHLHLHHLDPSGRG